MQCKIVMWNSLEKLNTKIHNKEDIHLAAIWLWSMATRRMEGGIWQNHNLLKKHNKGSTKTTMEVELVTNPIVICYYKNHN